MFITTVLHNCLLLQPWLAQQAACKLPRVSSSCPHLIYQTMQVSHDFKSMNVTYPTCTGLDKGWKLVCSEFIVFME